MNKSEIAPIIIGKLMNIGGLLQKEGDRLLNQFGLNQQQFSILFEINKAGKVIQKDMVNRLSLEKPHVSKIVKKLQKLNLISITQSNEDKRVFWLEATAKGKNTVSKCSEIFKKWNMNWADDIKLNQMKSLMNDLGLIQSIFKNHTHD